MHSASPGSKNIAHSIYVERAGEKFPPPPRSTREQFDKVRAMLGQQAVGIAQIAKDTGLTRQTVYRIKDDPAGAEVLWWLGIIIRSARSCGRHLGDYNPT